MVLGEHLPNPVLVGRTDREVDVETALQGREWVEIVSVGCLCWLAIRLSIGRRRDTG